MISGSLWLRDVQSTIAIARNSAGGSFQYLGRFPGAEAGVKDPLLSEYRSAGKTLKRDRTEGFREIESLAYQGSFLAMLSAFIAFPIAVCRDRIDLVIR